MSHLIYVIIFLIALLIINSVLSQNSVEHFFIDSTPVPMTVYKFTGRDLIFPYLGNSNLTAAERASYDVNMTTMPAGKCPFPLEAKTLDDSFAVVKENGIYYTLKKACMALTVKNYRFDNNELMITVTFPISTPENIDNMAKFLLINPLFVEFVKGMNNSIAYIPQPYRSNYTDRGFYFTNSSGYTETWAKGFNPPTMDIKFRVAVPIGKGTCDATFDYKPYTSKKYQLKRQDMDTIKKDGIVNMWVYYLDDLNSSFQTTNRNLPIEISSQGNVVVFDKNFKESSNDPYKTNSYNFMNTIYNMYNTFTVPIFTFSFDFIMTKSLKDNLEKVLLLKCWVSNNFYGGWAPCNNNVMQITSSSLEDFLELQFSIGDGSDCGYRTWFSPPATLWLPWLTTGTVVNITATFGINQKHIYAQWKDVNGGDSGKKFAYAKSLQNFFDPPFDTCTKYDDDSHREINNFTKIFGSKKFTPQTRPKLENIYLNWNTDVVRSITGVSLGYENLNNKFAAPK